MVVRGCIDIMTDRTTMYLAISQAAILIHSITAVKISSSWRLSNCQNCLSREICFTFTSN